MDSQQLLIEINLFRCQLSLSGLIPSTYRHASGNFVTIYRDQDGKFANEAEVANHIYEEVLTPEQLQEIEKLGSLTREDILKRLEANPEISSSLQRAIPGLEKLNRDLTTNRQKNSELVENMLTLQKKITENPEKYSELAQGSVKHLSEIDTPSEIRAFQLGYEEVPSIFQTLLRQGVDVGIVLKKSADHHSQAVDSLRNAETDAEAMAILGLIVANAVDVIVTLLLFTGLPPVAAYLQGSSLIEVVMGMVAGKTIIKSVRKGIMVYDPFEIKEITKSLFIGAVISEEIQRHDLSEQFPSYKSVLQAAYLLDLGLAELLDPKGLNSVEELEADLTGRYQQLNNEKKQLLLDILN